MKRNIIPTLLGLSLMATIAFSACSGDGETTDDEQTKQDSTETNNPTEHIKSENMTIGDTVTTASGLKVVMLAKGNGAQANPGDMVKVHYVGTLQNGVEFDNSVKRGEPFQFPLGGGRVIRGWDEGIALLREGDKATLIVPPSLGYGDQDMGNIPPNSTLHFDVELVEVKQAPKPVPYDVEGKKEQTTSTGLKYVVVKENKSGTKVKKGDMVEIDYTLYLEDGTVIDSSIPSGKPLPFQVGSGRVIPGFDEGISLMHMGEKYRLIIPSELGYGAQGAGGVVPPNATLVFDVEVKSVKSGS